MPMMYRATTKELGPGTLAVTVTNGSSYIIHMSQARARSVRLWLNGLAGSGRQVPTDLNIEGTEYFFVYEEWIAMLEALNTWYENRGNTQTI